MASPTSIQPTMQRTVEWLRKAGYTTTDSGDGVTNVEAGMEGALTVPHVFMRVPQANMVQYSHELRRLCTHRGLNPLQAKIEASYSPDDGIAVLALYGVTDKVLCG